MSDLKADLRTLSICEFVRFAMECPEQSVAVAKECRRRDEAVKRLVKAMRDICWYDWCDNDRDAVAAIERGRTALASLTGEV